MTLSSLIKKGGLIEHMTATSATLATQAQINTNSVATVAVTEPSNQEKLTQFVQKCCISFPGITQQVIDNLLSVDDEIDIINGDMSADALRLYIQVWIEDNMPYYSRKTIK